MDRILPSGVDVDPCLGKVTAGGPDHIGERLGISGLVNAHSRLSSPEPVDPEDTQRLRYVLPQKARVMGVDEARAKEITVSEIPLGRMVWAHEVASMIVFFASELASGVTGTNIDVDGGWVKCT